jgi:hypothetical protein
MPIWDNPVKGDSEIQGYQTKILEEFSRILDLSTEKKRDFSEAITASKNYPDLKIPLI